MVIEFCAKVWHHISRECSRDRIKPSCEFASQITYDDLVTNLRQPAYDKYIIYSRIRAIMASAGVPPKCQSLGVVLIVCYHGDRPTYVLRMSKVVLKLVPSHPIANRFSLR